MENLNSGFPGTEFLGLRSPGFARRRIGELDVRREPLVAIDEGMTMNSLVDWAVLVAAVGVVGMAMFQILLAAGFPLGAAAFGGANEVLPKKLRVASGASTLLFLAAFYFVLARGGLFGAVRQSTSVHVGIWIFAVVFALSALANVASTSRWERLLMAPIAILLCACCALLALAQ